MPLEKSTKPPPPPGAGPTEDELCLRDVLTAAPRPALTVLAAPRGVETRVNGSLIVDISEAKLPATAGFILLFIGARVDDEATFSLVRQAGEVGAAAVVVKRRGRPIDGLVTEASTAGVALLQVAESASWQSLEALISSLIGAAGTTSGTNRWSGTEELFAIANSLAKVFGGSVAIEDLDRRVLAYSLMAGQRIDPLREAGILQRRVPDTPDNRVQYQKVFAAAKIVRFSRIGDELPRSAVAVRAGVVPLGTIWAIEAEDEMPSDKRSIQERERQLLEAASVAAVHLLRAQHAGEIEQLVRGEVLLHVLYGGELTTAARARIGIPNGPAVLMSVALASATLAPPMPAIAGEAARYLAAFSHQAVVAATQSEIYILLPDPGIEGAYRLASGAEDSIRRTLGVDIRVAISSIGAFPQEMPKLYEEVTEVLRAARGTDLPSILRFADVIDRVFLQRLQDTITSDERLIHPAVQLLREHDEQHEGNLRGTLLDWLESQGDVTATAAKLTMHPNTVRYRVRRACEIAGIDLDKPDARLSLWLQLRADQTATH